MTKRFYVIEVTSLTGKLYLNSSVYTNSVFTANMLDSSCHFDTLEDIQAFIPAYVKHNGEAYLDRSKIVGHKLTLEETDYVPMSRFLTS